MLDLKDKTLPEVLFLFLSLCMGIAYVIAGAGLWYYRQKLSILEPTLQNTLSISLILYGLFRIYRVYQRAKTNI